MMGEAALCLGPSRAPAAPGELMAGFSVRPQKSLTTATDVALQGFVPLLMLLEAAESHTHGDIRSNSLPRLHRGVLQPSESLMQMI